VYILELFLLAKLNQLELREADVGNAYLDASTKEKVYIIGGPEFGDLAGHTLLIYKVLYGLRSSGLCWNQSFADVLQTMGFVQSRVESDIWMRENIKKYQTMIGCLQWADIQTATMTMSQFRAAPSIGNLNRLKKIYGYLKKFSSAAIRVRLVEPKHWRTSRSKF
jgi:Reverse transcriptase (RNA-dependent DNA polymerase)